MRAVSQAALRIQDGLVLDQHGTHGMTAHDGEDQLADALGSEGIGGNAASRSIDRMSSRERHAQRRRQAGLDADDLDAALVPGGNATDQATTADGDQQRIDVRRLALQLEADAALSQHGLDLSKAWTESAPVSAM